MIDPCVLPPTIRDAIYVTHMLGFRWLWVDSLCIIQDSDEDMAHEIGCMHHIYRYAHLTIVAGSAEGVNSGFLRTGRAPYKHIALPLICPQPHHPKSVRGLHGVHPVAQVRVGQVHLARRLYTPYSDELGWTAARAWCMQEYLMSPRTLIFTPTTLRLRCLVDVQDIGNSFCSVFGDPQIPDTLFLRDPPVAEPGSKEWMYMHEAWMVVVEDYTRRTASVESDKLIACAALAEQFHRVLDSEYLAGLWRSDELLVGLLWAVDKSETSRSKCGRSRPTAYRAPSWSWAAIDGVVNNHLHTELFSALCSRRTVALAEIVECRVTLQDPALRFGRVTDGALVLRGALIPCRREPHNSSSTLDSDACFAVSLPSFRQAQRLQWGLGGLSADEEGEVFRASLVGLADVHMDYAADELPGRMWIVPFVRKVGSTGDNWVQGIVLELAPPESQSDKTRFRRIGFFCNLCTGRSLSRLWSPVRALNLKDSASPWMDIVIV